MTLKAALARWLAPEEFAELERQKQDLERATNQRVADVLLQMDPFEPFLKKYNVIFSEEWRKPEERLDEQSRIRLFMWAAGIVHDPSFKHMTAWIINTQGNNTLRKGTNDYEWFFGRAAIITMDLFVSEVGRLASRYNEMLKKRDDFDPHLAAE
jgi:hypothetical protein